MAPIPRPRYLLVTMLTTADGLPGIFWLYMHKGEYSSSPRKIFLTLVNVAMVAFGTTIVSFALIPKSTSPSNDQISNGFQVCPGSLRFWEGYT